ncbi:hypothetical protein CXB40_28175 [Pseudomonas syringae pv. avii]|nr:hypothetical protein CXB40_28175 [Pseudomonas syringae pv. avii]
MPLTLSLVLLIENLLGLKTALESDVVLDKVIDLPRLRRVSSIFEPRDAARPLAAEAAFQSLAASLWRTLCENAPHRCPALPTG